MAFSCHVACYRAAVVIKMAAIEVSMPLAWYAFLNWASFEGSMEFNCNTERVLISGKDVHREASPPPKKHSATE